MNGFFKLSEISSGDYPLLKLVKEAKQGDTPVSRLDQPLAKEINQLKDRGEAAKPDTDKKDGVSEKEKLDQLVAAYLADIKKYSDVPDTISGNAFTGADLKKLSPEEAAKQREEFDDGKADLKKQWEKENGMPWPKYDQDVYSSNGRLIRKAGSDYDAHHIQPLGMGGKNEASNITPIHAEKHYDKQGIHSPDSPYSQMNKVLGGADQ